MCNIINIIINDVCEICNSNINNNKMIILILMCIINNIMCI